MLVFNTCTIREKADERFHCAPDGRARGEAARSVEGDRRRRLLVGVDEGRAVRALPVRRPRLRPGQHLAPRRVHPGRAASVPRGHFSTFDEFSGDLPMRRERAVPGVAADLAGLQLDVLVLHRAVRARPRAVAARRRARRRGRALAGDGVRELTLLGQNVNSWGRDLPVAERIGFGELLRLLDAVPGIERIRYTSPHPKDMRDDVIAAHRECASVCEHVHLPLQSGSTRILQARCAAPTRASASSRSRRALRDEVPGLALTTDIIVGFPGETEDDFARDARGRARRSVTTTRSRSSTRRAAARTPARMDEQVAEDVKRERLERLVERIQRHAARAQPGARRHACRRCSSRAPSRTDRGRRARHDAHEQDGALPGPAEPGELVQRARRGGDLADAPRRGARVAARRLSAMVVAHLRADGVGQDGDRARARRARLPARSSAPTRCRSTRASRR